MTGIEFFLAGIALGAGVALVITARLVVRCQQNAISSLLLASEATSELTVAGHVLQILDDALGDELDLATVANDIRTNLGAFDHDGLPGMVKLNEQDLDWLGRQ